MRLFHQKNVLMSFGLEKVVKTTTVEGKRKVLDKQ